MSEQDGPKYLLDDDNRPLFGQSKVDFANFVLSLMIGKMSK